MVLVKTDEIDSVARRLLRHLDHGDYADVPQVTGIPATWMATSFEREASSNFARSPAQGDPWNRKSTHVPRGRGPFKDWRESALDAYHIDGTDQIGAASWTWARACFEGELFNGFGYRDYHREHTPYLWGGTNNQQPGKYESDGVWVATKDDQLGMVPVMWRMVQLRPALALPGVAPQWAPAPGPLPTPTPSTLTDAGWVQRALNKVGDYGLEVDGSYGRQTKIAVRDFQSKHDLDVDGFAGPKTITALEAASGG